MSVLRFVSVALAATMIAAPAFAQAAPVGAGLADLALLGAGIGGLVIGRFGGRKRGGGER